MDKTVLGLTNNAKLLGAVTFDLPPIETCPGRSTLCEKVCYATDGNFQFPWVKRRRRRLLEYFNEYNEIPDIDPKVSPVFVRIFSSGDFHCTEMIKATGRFAKKYAHIPMVAFTRSWRVPELESHLRKLSKLPNFFLWLSADEETGIPKGRWARIAYMSIGDKPPRRKVDLVFRAFDTNASATYRRRKEHPKLWLNGPVCLAQRGVGKAKIMCAACRNCFTEERANG